MNRLLLIALSLLVGCSGTPSEPATLLPTVTVTSDVTLEAAATSSASTPTRREAHLALAIEVAPTMTAAAGLGMITRNRTWVNVDQTIEGVAMVYVPPGCFAMGSDVGRANERPLHTICIFEPFWLDKFEVTQAQFTEFGGVAASPFAFPGPNRPVEQITWVEARDYCIARGGRLPTEAEWEYAARGPDNWTYPWGGGFAETNTVFTANSGRGTKDVGSKPLGGSWVGAHDMSGNVWEWTSSQDRGYPYDAGDGRESDNADSNIRHVVRGGAWNVDDPASLGTTVRLSRFTVSSDSSTGFRCMRPYE